MSTTTTIEAGQIWTPKVIRRAGAAPKIILRVGPKGGICAARFPRRNGAWSVYTKTMLLEWIAINEATLVTTAEDLINKAPDATTPVLVDGRDIAQPDGSLNGGIPVVNWFPGTPYILLNGTFVLEELRAIVAHIEKHLA